MVPRLALGDALQRLMAESEPQETASQAPVEEASEAPETPRAEGYKSAADFLQDEISEMRQKCKSEVLAIESLGNSEKVLQGKLKSIMADFAAEEEQAAETSLLIQKWQRSYGDEMRQRKAECSSLELELQKEAENVKNLPQQQLKLQAHLDQELHACEAMRDSSDKLEVEIREASQSEHDDLSTVRAEMTASQMSQNMVDRKLQRAEKEEQEQLHIARALLEDLHLAEVAASSQENALRQVKRAAEKEEESEADVLGLLEFRESETRQFQLAVGEDQELSSPAQELVQEPEAAAEPPEVSEPLVAPIPARPSAVAQPSRPSQQRPQALQQQLKLQAHLDQELHACEAMRDSSDKLEVEIREASQSEHDDLSTVRAEMTASQMSQNMVDRKLQRAEKEEQEQLHIARALLEDLHLAEVAASSQENALRQVKRAAEKEEESGADVLGLLEFRESETRKFQLAVGEDQELSSPAQELVQEPEAAAEPPEVSEPLVAPIPARPSAVAQPSRPSQQRPQALEQAKGKAVRKEGKSREDKAAVRQLRHELAEEERRLRLWETSNSERRHAMQLETQLISDSIREIGIRCQMLVGKHRALLDDRKRLEAEA